MKKAKLIAVQAYPPSSKSVKPIIEQTGNGELLCHEKITGRWFRSSEEAIKRSISNLNTEIREQATAMCANELYSALGIYVTSPMYEYGWRRKDIVPWENLFEYKIDTSGEEPILELYSTIPAIRKYYLEDVNDGD